MSASVISGTEEAAAAKAAAADCQAAPFEGGVWECGRCALAWHEDDRRPPCSPVTYTRLEAAAIEEATKIEQSQRALVAAGLRVRPHQPALKRAMELRAIARLVEKIKPVT